MPPGVQFLHCIQQTQGEGGENQFVDGFFVAAKIKQDYPEIFDLLRTQNVEYWDAGTSDEKDADIQDQFHKRFSRPVIELNQEGEMVQVSYNNQVRSCQHGPDLESATNLYRGLKTFNDVCYAPECLINYRLQDGDCVVFDNLRVLHGRAGFTIKQNDDSQFDTIGRHLQGCYIDWDEIHDKINVLLGAKLF